MSLPKTFTIQLADGKTADCPALGFGTWAFEEGKTPVDPAHPSWLKDALKTGFDVGYRHIEGAWFYGVGVHNLIVNETYSRLLPGRQRN